MSSHRSASELVTLRKLSHACAKARGERPTTVHLLAAVCACEGPAQQLLAARRLDEEALLRAARAFDEEIDDSIQVALDAARDLAHRAALPSRGAIASARSGAARPTAALPPGGIHVLQALLSNRRFAAYRALGQCGVDVARLRTAATQLATGAVALPRAPSARARTAPTATEAAQSPRPSSRALRRSTPRPLKGPARAVEVPLTPPGRSAPANGKPRPSSKSTPDSKPRPSSKPSPSSKPHREPAAPSPNEPATTAVPVEDPIPSIAAGKTASPRRTSRDGPERWELDPAEFPTLTALGRNLTHAAAAGELDRVVAREHEIEQVLDILAKRHANSPLVIGPAGVGKTSVVRGVALHFASESSEAPPLLIELPLTELLAGTGARGALAERVAALRAEVAQAAGRVVLFVDEIHELFSSGTADELLGEIKAGLSRGEMALIGATTEHCYRRHIESDPVWARRFSLVEVAEPEESDAFLLLRSVAEGLQGHHGVSYADEAIAVAVSWSVRYLPGRALPDKAVAILDLAGARLQRRPVAAEAERGAGRRVEPEHVAEVVSELTEVPNERLLQTDAERMLHMEELLGERVVGHAEALGRIASVLRRNAAGLRGRRPIGTLLFLGPTGVGKTETAKAIAEALFHSPDAMTRIDMSEYAEAHTVARLIGAPPGYVGHEAGGILTEAVRRRPYQVVLLDEVEKAHRDVLEAFLQVFDEGRLTDGRGRSVDFNNAVIALTSNLGAEELREAQSRRPIGFGGAARAGATAAELRDVAVKAARTALPPELYNRIDEVIYFRALERDDVEQIAMMLLGGLADSLAERGVGLDIDPRAVHALMEAGGYDAELGARPMKRAIARLVEAPLADLILQGDLERGAVALLHLDDDGRIAVDAMPAARARSA